MIRDESSAVTRPGVVRPIALSLVMVVAGLAAPSTIGQFNSLFRGFGAEVPWLTSTVISFRVPICVALLLCLLAQVVLLIVLMGKRTADSRRLFYRMTVTNLLFFAVLIVAMYLPVFSIGAPV